MCRKRSQSLLSLKLLFSPCRSCDACHSPQFRSIVIPEDIYSEPEGGRWSRPQGSQIVGDFQMGRANIPRCNLKTRAPTRSPRILRQSLARPPPAPFFFLLPRLTTRPNSSRGAHPGRTVDLYFIFIACVSINSHWMYQPIISKITPRG